MQMKFKMGASLQTQQTEELDIFGHVIVALES